MLDNLDSKIKKYVDEHKKLEKDFNEVNRKMKAEFKTGFYLEKLIPLKEEYYGNLKVLYNVHRPIIEEEFNETEKALRSLVMVPIPQNMLNSMSVMDMLKNPSYEEMKGLIEATMNNYLASKKVYDAFNPVYESNDQLKSKIRNYLAVNDEDPIFMNVDHVIEEIENLKDYIMHNIFGAATTEFLNSSSYVIGNILSGSYISNVKAKADRFHNRFKSA